MNPSFVLFDLLTGNVITDFECENDAWDALRGIAGEDGIEAIENLSLVRMQNGHPTLIAMEEALVHRVAGEMSQAGDDDSTHPVNKLGSMAS